MKVPRTIKRLFIGRYPAFMWCLVSLMQTVYCFFASILCGNTWAGWFFAIVGPMFFVGFYYFGHRLKNYQDGVWEDEWAKKE